MLISSEINNLTPIIVRERRDDGIVTWMWYYLDDRSEEKCIISCYMVCSAVNSNQYLCSHCSGIVTVSNVYIEIFHDVIRVLSFCWCFTIRFGSTQIIKSAREYKWVTELVVNMFEDCIICVTCRKEEKDVKKVIECGYCHKCEHYDCKNVFGSAVRKLRSQPYFCSLQCSELHQQTKSTVEADSQMHRDIQLVLKEVRETRAEMHAVKNTVGDMEKFQSFLSEKLDTLLGEIQSTKSDHKALKTDVENLTFQQQSVCDRVDRLELDLDRINRSTVSQNAVIIGIPAVDNENPNEIVRKVAAAVGCQLPDDAILDVKRLLPKNANRDARPSSARPAPIKVCFKTVCHKEELLSKKKNHGSLRLSDVNPSTAEPNRKVIIRDELTPYGLQLLNETKDAQDQLGFKFVWPGRNGVVLVKHSESSTVKVIRSMKDLETLKRLSNKRLYASNSSSPDEQQPNPKRRL